MESPISKNKENVRISRDISTLYVAVNRLGYITQHALLDRTSSITFTVYFSCHLQMSERAYIFLALRIISITDIKNQEILSSTGP